MFIKSEMESFKKMKKFYESEIASISSKLARLQEDANRFAGDYAQVTNAYVGIDFWAWECEDPVNKLGTCVYDEDEDPSHDGCVFCGQPEERK